MLDISETIIVRQYQADTLHFVLKCILSGNAFQTDVKIQILHQDSKVLQVGYSNEGLAAINRRGKEALLRVLANHSCSSCLCVRRLHSLLTFSVSN